MQTDIVENLPVYLQRRMARLALAGWRFKPIHNGLKIARWDAHYTNSDGVGEYSMPWLSELLDQMYGVEGA